MAAKLKNRQIGNIGEKIVLKHFSGLIYTPDGDSDLFNGHGRRFEIKTCRKRTGKNACRWGQIRISREHHETLSSKDIYLIRIYEENPYVAELIFMVRKALIDELLEEYNSPSVHIPWIKILDANRSR